MNNEVINSCLVIGGVEEGVKYILRSGLYSPTNDSLDPLASSNQVSRPVKETWSEGEEWGWASWGKE